MKFECGDLERALAVPELMQEAREHLKNCPACRNELRLWNEIAAAILSGSAAAARIAIPPPMQ